MEDKNNFIMLSIVAVVAIVAIIVLVAGGQKSVSSVSSTQEDQVGQGMKIIRACGGTQGLSCPTSNVCGTGCSCNYQTQKCVLNNAN